MFHGFPLRSYLIASALNVYLRFLKKLLRERMVTLQPNVENIYTNSAATTLPPIMTIFPGSFFIWKRVWEV